MKITLSLLATIEGDLGALTDPANEAAVREKLDGLPTVEQIVASLRELAFIAESLGHLRNMPSAIEAADRARAIEKSLTP